MKKFIPQFIFNIYHYLLAFLGAVFYGFPGKKLTVIGVTGTNGKSTTVHLATEVLDRASFKTASMSSIRFKIGEKEKLNMLKMTMPGRFKLQKFLRDAVKADCKYVLLEVTSEGIKQFRHKFIDFDGAVFTNLTKEHLEAHKGFENYKKAKGELFKALTRSGKSPYGRSAIDRKNKFAIINIDDKNADYFLKLSKNVRVYTYGIKNKEADISPAKTNLEISLPGEFNIYNSLAAVCIGLSQNVELEKILKILKGIKKIPGRMELVIDKEFKVFVDYAHTPDALEKVYQTIQDSNLICVLGSCGGGRDKWKRPEMGEIAAKYCNQIILTNEDPYNENPNQILADVESGIKEFSPYGRSAAGRKILKILDREKAIAKALSLAKKGDAVIITGKGCEPWMCVEGGKKIKWDDREVVREKYKEMVA